MVTADSSNSSGNNRWFQANSDSTITVLFDETKPIRFSTAYWHIRGLGAPLRMMLCAAKINHVAYMYDFQEDGEHGWKSGYYTEKATKFIPEYTPFMNLPSLADEDEKEVITQLNACLYYAGKICGMMGQSPVEETKCVQYLCEIYDLRCTMTDYVYAGTGTAESVIKSGQGHFSKFENLLKKKEKKCFTVGDSMSAPDFHLFEMIDQYDGFQKSIDPTADILADYPNVRTFFVEFSKLEYVQSSLTRSQSVLFLFGSSSYYFIIFFVS